MKKLKTDGFTIIELLIATAVFSVVLLTVSAAITQIGRLYYKGITSAHTQEVARSVMDDIAQSIQFNVGAVVGTDSTALDNASNGSRAVCVATKHYSYKFGQQVTTGKHGLVVQEIPSGCTSYIAQNLDTGTVDGNEALGENMRLANLVVEPAGSIDTYRVTVRVVYGDSDLLCNPNSHSGGKDDCSSGKGWDENIQADKQALASTRNLSCKNIRTGTQFCAASELSTIVKRRLVE